MPEGDTVWLAARRLDEALGGQRLTRTDFRKGALAGIELSGRVVHDVASRGKHILFRLDDGTSLHTHFLMTGSWHLYRPGRPWRGGPAHHIRAVLETEPWIAVGYRLGVLERLDTRDEERLLGHLGPDLLDPQADLGRAAERVLADPARPIGAALLDQRTASGLGLIWVSEALFLAGVSPGTVVGEVPDVERVLRLGQQLLVANRARGAQVSTGNVAEPHYVYGRAGRPCLRCGTPIRYGRQGRGERTRDAYWCPTCQRGPAPVAS